MKYQPYNNVFGEPHGVVRFNDDGSATSFLADPTNTDYQAFLLWCEQGNTPEPANEVTE